MMHNESQKILLVRTDRMGDVVLTTPVIKIVRERFPRAHIGFLTTPITADIVQGNPYLDEVIIYDKSVAHKGILGLLSFLRALRKKKFDVAVILNPRKRFHWILALAKIPKRIGYRRKHGFLLTHALPDTKAEGKKSEAFYNEDLLSYLSIPNTASTELYFPLLTTRSLKFDSLKKPFVVLNVSASCPSKSWPLQNFAELARLLFEKLHLNSVLIGKEADCESVRRQTLAPVTSFSETLTLKELGELLKRAAFHISNDTGPMHIAASVKTPVIAIFGRTRPGLGPARWAPLGTDHIVLQKIIGCDPCLAHDCQLDFDCLKATKVEDVFYVAQKYSARLVR